VNFLDLGEIEGTFVWDWKELQSLRIDFHDAGLFVYWDGEPLYLLFFLSSFELIQLGKEVPKLRFQY